jgi:hypothetical protein
MQISDLGWGGEGGLGPGKKKLNPWENGPERQLSAQIEQRKMKHDTKNDKGSMHDIVQ